MNFRGEAAGMVAISGFIPEGKIEFARTMTSKEAPDAVFITETSENIAKHSQIPTLMRNNFFVRIFHDIVKLYSMPAYGEYDPSPIVAFSFSFFFGLMFGDLGHGAMLTLGALLLEKKKIMPATFSRPVMIAGIVSMFFGALYGSVFGSEDIISHIWLSPMKNINNLIVVSIIIGIVFLSLGLLLRLKILYRKSEWGKFFFSGEGLAGILFYWTAVYTLFHSVSGFKTPIIKWILIFLLVLLFMIIICGNYLGRKIFGNEPENKGAMYIFSVFHLMLSFISNTASFVRLAAFAVNHAGLSFAVYTIADMVRTSSLGGFYSAIIIIIGNIIIVALEGLIVFIQTLRLEYYEFFGKFFQGGGRAFTPMSWKE
jgi:V/A-type H+-transporting ATPase subunit I